MFKKRFNYKEYISMLSMLMNASFKSTEETLSKKQINTNVRFLNATKLSLIHFAADLSYHWLELDKDTVQKDLTYQFYTKYPEKFFLHINTIIKSPDTSIGDVYDFLVDTLTPEDAFSRMETLLLIDSELTPALNCFSAMFQATKRKDEDFIVNFRKYRKIAKQLTDSTRISGRQSS